MQVIFVKDNDVTPGNVIVMYGENEIDIIRSFINNDPVLSANLRFLIESNDSNLLPYQIALKAEGYTVSPVTLNPDTEITDKYLLLQGYKLSSIPEDTDYDHISKVLQGLTDEVDVDQYLTSIRGFDLVDMTIVSSIKEVRALLDITNTKLIINYEPTETEIDTEETE